MSPIGMNIPYDAKALVQDPLCQRQMKIYHFPICEFCIPLFVLTLLFLAYYPHVTKKVIIGMLHLVRELLAIFNFIKGYYVVYIMAVEIHFLFPYGY